MIIVDLQQVMISNFMVQIGKHTNIKIDEDLLRHMILNSIRKYNYKFRNKYGEMVIACDDKKQWRKSIYPYYKASRKKSREKSDLDWGAVFEVLNKIRSELAEYFPYRVIQVETAEADDVIGTLSETFANTSEPILIISGDKDFRQLQTYMNVEQYDPVRDKWIRENDPERYLKEHIMKGDTSDGIPNFLSKDDTFVTAARQKPLRQTNIDKWIALDPIEFCDETMLRNYMRNQQLVDLSFIPADLKQAIISEYEAQAGKGREKLFNYFIERKLRLLITDIGQF